MAKRVFVVLAVLVTLTSVYSITRASLPVAEAAAPTTLNFQARLLNSSGSLVADGDYNVEFKIYNASSSSGSSQGACSGDANCLWTETRTGANKIQVKNGYLSAYLGDITALPTNIWNQQLYLTMNIGGTGAASWDGEMTPRIRLTSVPYAFRATIAESAETLSKNTGSFTGTVDFATMTADRRYLFPDTSLATTASPGTICVYNGAASNCPAASGSAYYIQNDTVLQTQTNFNIQGRDSGANGTVVGVLQGAANGQTVDLLQFKASGGTVLAAVTAAGNLQVASSIDTRSAGTLTIGNSTATAITLGKSGVTTTNAGALTVTELGMFNGGLTSASNFTVTSAGNIAFQRNTTNYTGIGTQDDIDFGTGALFRITSASALTITSITGGTDGRVITLANASANAVTITNDAGGTATNRIITGTGANLSVPAGSTVQLAYDSADSRWRIIGGTATSGGGANQQLSNLTSTNLNAALNATANDLTLQTTTSGNIILNSAGTIELQDNTNVTGTLTASVAVQAPILDTATATALNIGTTNATNITIGHNAGTIAIDATNLDLSTAGVVTLVGGQAADLTTQANQNLTVQANGTGTIVLNDTVTVSGTTTFSGVTTDITTGTNEDLTIDANGTGLLQLSDSVVVAANQYLKLTGGNTASRPASPTEGMLYYDTETDQLLVYTGTKWQAEGQEAVLVAANDSSPAAKAAADYIADGTADEVEINNAIAESVANTGSNLGSYKVYLFAGTYTTTDTISLPNNVTLSGAGKGTLIQFGNLGGVSKNMITNATTGGTGTGITIRDLKLDGNKSTNNTDTFSGIYLDGLGSPSTHLAGATISNVTIQNFENNGIHILNSANNIITGNTIQTNDDHGIFTNGANHDVITGNTITGNTLNGIYFNATARDIVSNNFIGSNGNFGIRIETGNTNTITDNVLRSNTGSGSNSSIILVNTDTNLVTNNNITDTAGTGYAIDISDTGSDSNYLSNNTFSGTGASSINDNSGGDTIYAGQVNGSTNYVIQPAGTVELMKNTNVTGILTASTSVLAPAFDTATAVALTIGTTNATNITIGHNAGTLAIDQTNFDLATNGVMTLAGGQTADITTQANQNLTVVANGTGTIVLNDTVTVTGTQTFSGVTTDITTGTNEDLTIDANGTGLLQLSDSVVVAAQQTIRFVGGTTAQRPASPSEGMMYFDTDTDKLLIYSNGKWQGDRRDVTKTVAPSNATQEIKDSADYVATGSSDQTVINAALTAAAGGRVYLFEGTFTTDDAISIPNNTVLAGSGTATLIQFANIAGQTKSMIINTDTTTGTGVTVRDLRLDGNEVVNTTGSFTGIYFNGLGGYGTERRGALIQGVTAQNFLTQGIRLENSVQSILTGSTANNSGGTGIFLQSSSHNTITGNTASGNGVNGIGLNASSNNTITANTTSNNTQSGLSIASSSNHNAIDGNTSYANGGIGISLTTSSSHNTVSTNTSNANGSNGISLNAAHNNSLVGNTSSNNTLNGIGLTSANQNTLTGDTTSGNGTNGFSLSGSSRNTITGSSISSNLAGGTLLTSTSDDNVISSGVLYDNGGSGAVSSITVTSSSNNKIIGNRITDTAGTAYAINISNAGASTNYLADNTFSGTGATTINDAGTGTIFAGQVKDSSNGNYFIQPAGTVELMKNTNVSGTLTASTSVLTPLIGRATAGTLSVGTDANSTAITISRDGILTTISGDLQVDEDTTISGGLTVGNGGFLSFQRNTTDYTATGTQNDINFGTGALFRITSASPLTITSIALGLDGRIITLINDSSNNVTIQNDAGGTASNRIITGTGTDLIVPAGASITLAYDSADSRWRVIGTTATAGGSANQQLSNLSGTVAINASLTPNADNTLDLGSSGNSWRTLYADTSVLTPTVDTAAATTLNVGTTTANAVSISRTGVTTTVNGALTVTQAGTFNGGLTSASNFTVTNAGNVAFQRNTTDFTTTGTSNDVNLGTGVMFRLNGASAQTITSIQGGTDGRVITLINAGANTAFIENDTGGTAANRIVTGTGGTLPIASGASIQLGYDSAASRWRVIGGSATAGGGANQQLSNLSGTVAINLGLVAGTDNAIDLGSSSFGWRSLYADTSVLTPNLDTATATALNIGSSTASSIVIGQTGAQTIRVGQNGGTLQLDGTNFDLSTAGVITLAGGQTSDITTANASTANGITIKPGNSTGSNIAGPTLTLQGGAATAGNANGGAVNISGGAGVGTGVQGLVNLSTTAFNTSTTQVFGSSGSLTAGLVDTYSTIPVSASTTGVTVTIPAPAIATVGRVLYISNVGATNDFNISLAGTSITIALKPNTTATLIWNGNGWTAAGASSSTDLQSAYNNTLTSAGGAEIVLNPTGGAADGFTIRNNGTTPISGGLLEVQSSIGTNLFSVNNYATEYATNGGAETAGASSTAFPANTWSQAPTGGTVTREPSATGFIATGQASVKVVTGAATDRGAKDTLSQALISGRTYQVSFTAKLSGAGTSMSTLVVAYSDNGTTATSATCATGQSINGDTWSKVTCTFVAAGTITSSNAVVIRQSDATARTFYIDNLSVTEISSTTTPSNVQVGGGLLGGQPTLFTLDRFSSAPVSGLNSTYYGSMYYDTTTNRIQCYEADGWGACGSAPDNIITLTPEYTGAVLNGTGVGVMTADLCANQPTVLVVGTLCASGEARNYYRWTSPQATLQDYSIFVSYKLPSTFKEFTDNNTMKLTAYRDDADDVDALVKMATYRKNSAGGLTLCGTETNITQSSGSWEQRSVTGNENSCSFTGGDYIIFKITMSSRNNTNVYVENLDFTYTNR